MSGFAQTGLVFSLRNGETCALSDDTLTVGQRQIPLSSIVATGLVADSSVLVPPGMPPAPGVSLRLTDGSTLAFTPVEQLDCWRVLHALAAARPELNTPLPPPPGQTGPAMGFAGYGPYGAYGPAYGYPPYMGNPPTYRGYPVSESDKMFAGLCHLSHFFLPVILPFIIWLAMRDTHPYASSQGKQAFIFQLFFAIIAIGGTVGMEVFFFSTFANIASQSTPSTPPNPASLDFSFFPILFGLYGLLILVGIITLVYSIVGAVKAFQGRPFHYPLLGKLQ